MLTIFGPRPAPAPVALGPVIAPITPDNVRGVLLALAHAIQAGNADLTDYLTYRLLAAHLPVPSHDELQAALVDAFAEDYADEQIDVVDSTKPLVKEQLLELAGTLSALRNALLSGADADPMASHADSLREDIAKAFPHLALPLPAPAGQVAA